MCYRCQTVKQVKIYNTKDEEAYQRGINYVRWHYLTMPIEHRRILSTWTMHFEDRVQHTGIADVCAYLHSVELSRVVIGKKGEWHYAAQYAN